MLIRSYKSVRHSMLQSQNSEIPFPALFVDNSSLFQAIQVALVICVLFIFELAYFIGKISPKRQQTFYLQIQDSRFKMIERIYLE